MTVAEEMTKEIEACRQAEREIGGVDDEGKVRAIVDSDAGLAHFRAKAKGRE